MFIGTENLPHDLINSTWHEIFSGSNFSAKLKLCKNFVLHAQVPSSSVVVMTTELAALEPTLLVANILI